jgi:hypothetical protein
MECPTAAPGSSASVTDRSSRVPRGHIDPVTNVIALRSFSPFLSLAAGIRLVNRCADSGATVALRRLPPRERPSSCPAAAPRSGFGDEGYPCKHVAQIGERIDVMPFYH